MPLRNQKETKDPDARQVNNLLHTLRGEQFRHAQNLQRSKTHLSRAASCQSELNNPSLPFSQIFHVAAGQGTDPENAEPAPHPRERPRVVVENGIRQYASPRGGPPEPKSWSAKGKERTPQDRDTPAWRAAALELVLEGAPDTDGAVPPLRDLCLRVLRGLYPGPDFPVLAELLPPHLRAALVRWAAVHAPLPGPALAALCAPDGHADGELLVVGPAAALRDVFRADGADVESDAGDEGGGTPSACESAGSLPGGAAWDDPAAPDAVPPPLHTLALLRTALPAAALFALPPTLTRLALVALPGPAPLHRLPRVAPLLEVLDLSFNPWLARPAAGAAERVLDRVEWRRWGRLRVLGLRECGVGGEVVRRVNEGRWADVEVVGVEAEGAGRMAGVLTRASSSSALVAAMNDMNLQP
ncbi:hypothetical protein OBBRIDRAFT_886388 [Obba rivulosa]|uniref:Uncharacterized protein n=1 Tax=Obba rivulosa TaxID=1052685 RepID=A0A8E2DM38_9APHY|nr:hypothetical protein OBBRIDRAFT_886388 [Obba rivulosa]